MLPATKRLWAKEFGGFPPNDFFHSLDPLLNCFTSRLFKETYTADQAAGYLSAEWAQRLGLSTDVIIGVGAFDAHMGAVGGQIEAYHLSKVMGTSTCDMLVAPMNEVEGKLVKGICGQVPGSVIPGMMGMEAGQSCIRRCLCMVQKYSSWPLNNLLQNSSLTMRKIKNLIKELSDKMIRGLSLAAEQLPLDESENWPSTGSMAEELPMPINC